MSRSTPPGSVLDTPDAVDSTLRGPVNTASQFHLAVEPPAAGLEEIARLGDLRLFAGGRLRTVDVTDQHGSRVGMFLGIPVSIEGERVLSGVEQTGLDADSPAFVDDVESFLYAHGGSWLFVLSTSTHERVYLDANGTLSLVFEPDGRRAASTAGALLSPDEYVARFRTDLFRDLDVAHEGWFPSGITAHEGVSRLLCNHYLDLRSWTVHRHWPIDGVRPVTSVDAAAGRILDITRSICRALLPLHPVCSLSGGNETRFLLSAMREFHEQVTFATVAGPSSRRDVVLARRLAQRFGLEHRELPVRWASPEQQRQWLRQAGHAIGGSNVRTHPTIWGMETDHQVQLGGLGGEIGRGYIWRPGDDDSTRLGPSDLVPRLGLASPPPVAAATATWFETVEDYDPLLQLDLAYLELRMSAWAFAQTYTNRHRLPLLHPMISRESYELMMGLPSEARRQGSYIPSGIAQGWPELLDIPINRYGDVRDTVQWLSRATDPRRILKKARKLYG